MTMTDLPLRPLGRIARLQIQRSSLKLGDKSNHWYDPTPLLAVDELTLTPAGAQARQPDGSTLVDIHNASHPDTRNLDRTNDLSIGFTPHYTAMRDRFGPHLVDGCAGENILIETPGGQPVTLADLAGGVFIQSANGTGQLQLSVNRVAHPCRDFSAYSAGTRDAEPLKAALQFLDNGLRGFYCSLASAAPVTVAVGDQVLVGAAGQ